MTDKTKCAECSKIVRFYGIQCKCLDANNMKKIFCSTCINVKDTTTGHICTFDYKQSGRDQLLQNNPSAIPPKIQKF